MECNCHSSADLFGCVSLRKKQYCILNKQYSKEEYEELVGKIKKHMDDMPYVDGQGKVYRYGEFFPVEFAPLAFNESFAHNYYPKKKDEVESLGFIWKDPDPKEFDISMKAEDLPDHISDVGDDITNQIIGCMECKKAYRIVPFELEFLRKFNISLPRYCPLCRYARRLTQRNPRALHKRQCMCEGKKGGVYENTTEHFHGDGKCPNEFETTYGPDREEIVYCEECYKVEIV